MPIALLKVLRRWSAQVPLQWVLTLPFVVPMVGAVGLVGYLSYRSGQETVENLGHQFVASTNDRVVQELTDQLEKPILINRLNVDAVNQGQLDLQNVTALESALLNRLQQFEQVSAVLFVSPNGMVRLVERYPSLYLGIANPPQPNQILIYQLDSQGKRGKLIHTDQGIDIRRDRPFYAKAVTTRKPGWSAVSQYGNAKELALNAFHPVYDRTTQQLLGVFAVHLRLNQLNQFLYNLDISRAGQVIIIEPNGDIVATSSGDRSIHPQQSQAADAKLARANIYQSQDDLMRSLGQVLRDRSNSSSSTQLLEFNHHNKPHYVKITPFQTQDGLNWQILTVIPQSYFMGTIQDNLGRTILLSLGALGVAIALGLIANELLLIRFNQLNRASQLLATGNLAQPLPTDRPVFEFNRLARAFNQMADQVQRSLTGMKMALAESEEWFTVIFHASPDPIALTTFADGHCIEVNESFLKLVDYSREELIGQKLMDLDIWRDASMRFHFRELLMQQEHIGNLEIAISTRTGTIKTLLLSAERIEINGEAYILSIGKDITDRKHIEEERQQAELALQQSESRYRAIVEDQTELICRMTVDGTVLFVNDAYCRYFGLRREEMLGKSYLSLIYQEDQNDVVQLIQRLNRTNPTATSENRVVVNETVRWMQWVDRALFDDQGNIIEIQSVGRDITELKQAETALRKSETALLHAQQIAHLGSWEVDIATRETTWSEEVFRILGIDPTQSSPSFETFINVVPLEDKPLVTAAVQDMVTNGTPCNVEHRIQRQDGSVRYVISRGEVLVNQQQQVAKLYGTVLDITDLKQVEAALQKSETRFQKLAAASPSVIYTIVEDQAGPIFFEYLSPAFETLHEVPIAVAIQNARVVAEQIHPDDRESYRAAIHQSIVTMQPFRHEWRIITPSGKIKWLQANSQPQAHDGNIVWHGIVQDVTDRKLAEAALQESDARFRQLAETVQEGFFIFETATAEYSYLNPACIKLTGVPLAPKQADQVYARGMNHWLDNIHPDDRGRIVHALQAERQGQDFDEEYRFICPDGELRWLRSKAFPIPDQTGTIVRIVGTVEDITERKQVEEALRDSEERFRRAFDDAPIGISLVSENGQFLKANTFYCNLLGYTEAELTKLKFSDITHPADLEADITGMRQMVAGKIHSFQMEKRYVSKQGTIIPVIMRTAPIRNHDGKILYLVGHIQDLRDRLKVERMKDEFISVVSHELRTPLTSIRGALGILESGVFNTRPDKSSHMLKIALTNSERLVRLVNDILDLERLQSGKVNLIQQSCQVADLMQQAVESVQTIADQSSITLSLTPLSAIIWADPDAIVQTLTNLLSNAIKFSAPAQTVWLRAKMIHPPLNSTPAILFTVEDGGRGIPADKLDLIFEQFQQVDVSDSRQKGGTGLGLAICKNIVQQHGGRIWVESTLGEGSTFYFTVPLKKE